MQEIFSALQRLARGASSFTSGTPDLGVFKDVLIKDPFFDDPKNIGSPELPNGVAVETVENWFNYQGLIFDPTCFKYDLAKPEVGYELPDSAQLGRLDGNTYLIEKYHNEDEWPLRAAWGE